MLCGLSQIVLPVTQPETSWGFYTAGAGFAPLRADDNVQDLDAGGILLRLQPTSAVMGNVHLRLQTTRIEACLDRLVSHGGCISRSPTTEGPEKRAVVLDPDNHRLELWRPLRESELPEPVPLPIVDLWDPGAETLMMSLLDEVPEEMRDLARDGAVAEAELLAEALPAVDIQHAIRGFIRSSPRLFRERLHEPLTRHGIHPEDYTHDFQC